MATYEYGAWSPPSIFSDNGNREFYGGEGQPDSTFDCRASDLYIELGGDPDYVGTEREQVLTDEMVDAMHGGAPVFNAPFLSYIRGLVNYDELAASRRSVAYPQTTARSLAETALGSPVEDESRTHAENPVTGHWDSA